MDLPTESQLEAELATRAEASLIEFVRQAWRWVEPATPFVENWHHAAVCEHLQAVTEGQIRNLLVNIPPRHTKSKIACVIWPAWVWLKQPGWQWLFSSYAASLATRDSVACRTLIDSPWYQRHWGDRFTFKPDQNLKQRYENQQGGHRISVGVGGGATGEGGDTLVIDDPHNLKDIYSRLARDSVRIWYDQVWCSRLNDPQGSSQVCIMQRCHGEDLAAHILDQGDVVHLKVPSEAKQKLTVVGPLSGTLWKREEGELLWPGRFDKPVLTKARTRMGGFGYAGQHQQEPAPESGGIFKRAWWKFYEELPGDIEQTVQSWDTGLKDKADNDPSACVAAAQSPTGIYLTDAWAERLEFPELKAALQTRYDRDHPNVVLVEDKVSGISAVQTLNREALMPILAIPVEGNKVVRARAVSPTVEAGNVWLPKGAPWVADFIDLMADFPSVPHDDIVDAFTQLVAYLMGLTKNTLAVPRLRVL